MILPNAKMNKILQTKRINSVNMTIPSHEKGNYILINDNRRRYLINSKIFICVTELI